MTSPDAKCLEPETHVERRVQQAMQTTRLPGATLAERQSATPPTYEQRNSTLDTQDFNASPARTSRTIEPARCLSPFMQVTAMLTFFTLICLLLVT